MSEDGSLGIIVLCDGAGSCSSSEIGAKVICDWFPPWVDSRVDWWSLRHEEIPDVLVPAIRERLKAEAAIRNINLNSLSSTFLAVTARRAGDGLAYRVLHLGDGVAACISRDGNVLVSEPDNGEFANETVFTTSEKATSCLRVTEGTLPHGSGFVLMSDGAAASLYLKKRNGLAPATAEMLCWLNAHDSDIVSAAIMENMKALFRNKTGDDCAISLLLDRCCISPFSVELEHPQPELHQALQRETFCERNEAAKHDETTKEANEPMSSEIPQFGEASRPEWPEENETPNKTVDSTATRVTPPA